MKYMAIFTAFLAMAGAVQADVVVDFPGTSGPAKDLVVTLSNLNTVPTIDKSFSVSGSLSGAATLGASDSVIFTMNSSILWVDRATAEGHAADFDTYMAGIKDSTVRFYGNDWAAGSGSNAININQAVFMTITKNTSADLKFKGATFALTGGADTAQFLIWDSETKTFLADQQAKSTGLALGSFSLTTGDIIVFGATAGDYRVDKLTFDVIPEPATLGSVAVFGAGILIIRRRFMI